MPRYQVIVKWEVDADNEQNAVDLVLEDIGDFEVESIEEIGKEDQ